MTLSVVGSRKAEAVSDSEQIIEMLERKLSELREGRTVTHAILLTADMSDVETFELVTTYHGRAVACMGLLALAEGEFRADILGQ